MIDTDEYIQMWDDNLLGSEGVNDLMNALIAEVKRLREEISRLNKWEDNVREFFGDEAMIDLYDIYGVEGDD
tara:strand:+ start:446 stop:661 length:216 start_codon:yes stop_codon:yes gene_type:complete